MSNSTDIRTGRHVVHQIHIHLVFVTKYRKTVFTAAMLNCLQLTFAKVCNDFESELIEFEGERGHVHLLINYPPKVTLSKLVNGLKGVSSRILRKNFSKELAKFLWKGVLWSPSYFAGSCGGATLNVIKQYIQNQNSPQSEISRNVCLTSST